ncbi:unnamed protein product [Dracunculus medinensis]|uniref:LRRcap domain-containing protein n=1 Tax=Dracunculus medinensis TaxID=318479 RepID=A0A0N4UAP6_DRAME|nr:unnamed protein product [Dracunculus medinensis]
MEAKIKAELRGRDPSKVKRLRLVSCHSQSIVGITTEFTSLRFLSITYSGLISITGLPRLPWLCRLDLSHNSLGDASLNNLPELCPNLRYISLCDNDIRSMRALIPLSKLKKLETIELMDNEIIKNENFRTKVFELMDRLLVLDGRDSQNREIFLFEDYNKSTTEEEVSETDEEKDDEYSIGLDYLEDESILEDEDESEDYKDNSSVPEVKDKDLRRCTKRKHEDEEREDV